MKIRYTPKWKSTHASCFVFAFGYGVYDVYIDLETPGEGFVQFTNDPYNSFDSVSWLLYHIVDDEIRWERDIDNVDKPPEMICTILTGLYMVGNWQPIPKP